MTITYSVEKLYHFNCDKCRSWWTIGDWKPYANYVIHMTCPQCGSVQLVAADSKFGSEKKEVD